LRSRRINASSSASTTRCDTVTASGSGPLDQPVRQPPFLRPKVIQDPAETGDLTLPTAMLLDGQVEVEVGHGGLGDQHPKVALLEARPPLRQALARQVQGRLSLGDLSTDRGESK
jgi:hypothetical protein